MKRLVKQITCRCAAYRFPHRKGGGKCGQVRLLLDVMQSHTGLFLEGDDAAEFITAYGNAYDAAVVWRNELKDERNEAAIRY